MLLRNRFALSFALTILAVLAGCSSGAHSPTPPPSGAFSNTDFNGTYTFSALGADENGEFAMAGSFTACGCTGGTISGGFIDLSDTTGAAPQSTIASSSTYSVNSDGRGTVTLDVNTASSGSLQIGLDFVLTSSSHGLIIRFDSGGTGSGTIDLQPAQLAQSSLTGAYTYSLSGADTNGNPISAAGSFTINADGTFATSPAGVADFNYGATPYASLTLTGGLVVGTAGQTSAGTAALDSTFGDLPFDVYAIDATHLKLIENDGNAVLVGDVFTQQTSIPQGNYVFTGAGEDSSGDLFALAGIFASDGASNFQNGAEDVNENGTTDGGTNPATPESFTGTFVASPTGSGRFQVALTNFAGGGTFAAYPSSGGLFLVEEDQGLNAGVTSLIALAQTSTAIASSTGYGLNLTGVDLTNEVELDEIAEFTASSSGMTGLVDVNDDGPESPKNLTGTYTQGSNGVGSATFTAGGFGGMFFYTADDTTTLLLSTDTGQVAAGLFQAQTTPSSSAKASRIASAVSQKAAMVKILSVPRRSQKHGPKNMKLGHQS
jgi:hypothetical protein